MNEQKKDAALDEEALEGVTGGAYSVGGVSYGDSVQGFIDQAWDKILGKDGSDDDKEQQP